MPAFFCQKLRRTIRHIRMKPQNRTVLTVEFTRIPLSRRGEAAD
jgi:hypothetical protein